MLLIDGNNLWYAVMARGEPLAGISRTDLLAVIDHYANRSGEHIVVVLDGYPASGPPRRPTRADRLGEEAEREPAPGAGQPLHETPIILPHSGCQHLYAAPRSADAVIEQIVSDSTEPRRLTVVSSDRELIVQVRKRRVHVIDAQEFALRLEGWLNRPRHHAAPEPAAKRAGLGGSRDSLKDWLLFFDLPPEASDISKGERASSVNPVGGDQTRRGVGSVNQSSPSPADASDSSSARQGEGQQGLPEKPAQPGPLDRAFQGVEPLKRRKRDVGNRRQGS
jgi:predicted RNA-binding protein with PIN domain